MPPHKLIDLLNKSTKHCTSPIQCKLAYATSENFLGRRVQGYHINAASLCLLAPKAAAALCQAQNQLNQQNLGLFVFDSYRPLSAVKDFGIWMQQPVKDDYELARKAIHYPHIEKNQLAELGYVCDKVSNHCFGDTIDLSLIDLNTQQLLDMGACFDYFDEISHTTAPPEIIGKAAFANRQILANAMQQAGFIPYEKEYWHFTFAERECAEPMDFEIK
jgi:D-alanyl-D-alanine dipeptidase